MNKKLFFFWILLVVGLMLSGCYRYGGYGYDYGYGPGVHHGYGYYDYDYNYGHPQPYPRIDQHRPGYGPRSHYRR